MKSTKLIADSFFKNEYLLSHETLSIYTLLDRLRNDKWVKKDQIQEIIQNYILKNEEVIQKLIQIAVITSIYADAVSAILSIDCDELDKENNKLVTELKEAGKL